MRRLLIVDDEPIAVEGIRSGVDWEALGLSEVLTAHGAEQAKAVFARTPIDVMLCDIEMPQGSGLQLLEWVRAQHPRTETIFLTCHADFQYAKQAIQLGSLDYLLKPIPYADLEAAVRKALRKIDEESERSAFSQYGKYWVQHQPLLVERFWLDVLGNDIPSQPEAVRRAAEERNIPYSGELRFLPVLIRIRRWYRDFSLRDKKIMEYALRNSAEELVLERHESGLLLSPADETMLALLGGDGREAADPARLKAACEAYMQACPRYFYCDVACYIGEPARGHEIAEAYRRLLERDADNVAYDSRVFLPGELPVAARPHALPDMGVWAMLLKEGARDKVLQGAEDFIGEQVRSGGLTPALLNPFIQDFQQMIHYVLQVKGIQAHQLLGDRESAELYARAARSAHDALAWVRHAVNKSLDYAAALEHSPSVVEQAKAYIHAHLEGDISREDIAAHVFLNPDYLTRIFKRDTGQSISDYLLQQRLAIAAQLLAHTDMPVSAVAGRIGYANFSHFSRMFKKYMNAGPAEYRQQHADAGNTAEQSRQSDSRKS
ncbi:response regulator [Cohnella sp. 56]|uniref:response regulator n=1 Tax=Cohnella sp. 56 TaxID=3113722 RepID=UPI0030E972DA